jgi:hypothetical protein
VKPHRIPAECHAGAGIIKQSGIKIKRGKKGNSARDAVVSMVKRLLGIVCRERQQYKALAFPFFLTINKQAQAD